jgi:polyphosphate kinase
MYISSADMMSRNLDYRVEVMVPIKSNNVKDKIIQMLNTYWKDTANSWELKDTKWQKIESDQYVNSQNEFIY